MKLLLLLSLFINISCRTLGNIPSINLGAYPDPTPKSYQPNNLKPIPPIKKTVQDYEFDFMLGSYIARNGFLKKLGDVGPTIGFNFKNYKEVNQSKIFNIDLGWYLHGSLDHFFNTDSKFLKPKFFDENYTNYMWSAGPSIRYHLSKNFKMDYAVGPSINFLEINTSGSNANLSNEEATTISFSLIHQLGFYYFLDDKKTTNQSAIGLNLLYYYMPNALGEFAAHNTELKSYSGGSFSLMLSMKTITF